jgi:hypothetical protein
MLPATDEQVIAAHCRAVRATGVGAQRMGRGYGCCSLAGVFGLPA